jgi:hypothetical protein
MDKLFLFRTLIVAFMFCLLIWDGSQLLTHSAGTFPQQHKQLLLTCALLWIATVFMNQNSNDDDWAGQF